MQTHFPHPAQAMMLYSASVVAALTYVQDTELVNIFGTFTQTYGKVFANDSVARAALAAFNVTLQNIAAVRSLKGHCVWLAPAASVPKNITLNVDSQCLEDS